MKKKIKYCFVVLVIASFFISMVPMQSIATSEPDLKIIRLNVTHNPLRTRHTAWVTVKNIGNYPVQDSFKLALFFEERNTQTGFHRLSMVKVWTLNPLPSQWQVLRIYTHSWTNPDPNIWEARFYAIVDYYDDIDESNENNNNAYGNWWP